VKEECHSAYLKENGKVERNNEFANNECKNNETTDDAIKENESQMQKV